MVYKIASCALLASGLTLITSFEVKAAYINNIDEFYTSYSDYDFSEEQQDLVEEVFNIAQPFLGENGKQAVIDAGAIPFLFPLQGHGEHWFLPSAIGSPAEPNQIVGFNIDENNQVAGLFWTQSKYSLEKYGEFVQNVASSPNSDDLVDDYQALKANYQLPTPSIFDAFGHKANWHSHENTTFYNLGTLDPNDVEFTQSLFDENFVSSVAQALAEPSIVAAPFETDLDNLDYPFFNSLMVPGFYMIHMWLGRHNETGLFANTHPDVAPDAIGEHLTFEDISDFEDHHNGGHGHNGDGDMPPEESPAESIPEPSLISGLIALALMGLTSLKSKN